MLYSSPWILCSSEFTVPSQEAYEEIHLSSKDIATDSKANPQILKVTIKESKFNPFTHGTTLFLRRTETSIRSVTGILPFLVARENQLGPFDYHIRTIWLNYVTNITLSFTCNLLN